MLIFDQNINKAVCEKLDATEKSLKIIMYSISPRSSRSHKLFFDVWKTLEKTIKRIPSTKILLSGWPESNPQNAASLRAAMTLANYGADVIVAQPGRVIHPKAFNFDDKILLIGSHNATEAGFTRTQNISYMGGNKTEIGQFNDYFQKAWESATLKK